MNNDIAKLVLIRSPQGIATITGGRLLDLVNSHKCLIDSSDFQSAWDAACQDKYGQTCELIGITYADQ